MPGEKVTTPDYQCSLKRDIVVMCSSCKEDITLKFGDDLLEKCSCGEKIEYKRMDFDLHRHVNYVCLPIAGPGFRGDNDYDNGSMPVPIFPRLTSPLRSMARFYTGVEQEDRSRNMAKSLYPSCCSGGSVPKVTNTGTLKDFMYPYDPALNAMRKFCAYSSECEIKDDELPESYMDKVSECIYAEKHGCPYHFSKEDLELEIPIEFSEKEDEVISFTETDTMSVKDLPFFKAGIYNGKRFTEDDLEQIETNFKSLKSQIQPPLKLGHGAQKFLRNEGMPAVGWIHSVRKVGDTLFADISNIPKRIYELIKKKTYRRPSAEIYRNFKTEDGKSHGVTLAAISLLGADIPAIKSLTDIESLFKDKQLGVSMSTFNIALETNQDNILTVNFDSKTGEEDDTPMTEEERKVMKDIEDKLATIEKSSASFDKEKAEFEEEREKLKKENEDLVAKNLEETKRAEEAEAEKLKLEEEVSKQDDLKYITELTTFLDEHLEAGRVLPKACPHMLALMTTLANDDDDPDALIVFSNSENGDKSTESVTQLTMFKKIVEMMPNIIKFEELSKKYDPKGDDISREKYYEKEFTSESDFHGGKEVEFAEIDTADEATKLAAELKISYADALVLATQKSASKMSQTS